MPDRVKWAFAAIIGVGLGVPPAAACTVERVAVIESARLEVQGTTRIVTAEGTVTTAGWTAPALRGPRFMEDGTEIYEFVACRPDGFAAQVLSPVSVRRALAANPRDSRAVIILGKTNSWRIPRGPDEKR